MPAGRRLKSRDSSVGGSILWSPPKEVKKASPLRHYRHFVECANCSSSSEQKGVTDSIDIP